VNRIDQGLAVKAAQVLGSQTVDKELRTVLRGLPVMIRINGLAMTCAYLLSRSKNQNDRYWSAASALLTDAATVVGLTPDPKPVATLNAIAALEGQNYLLAEAHGRLLAGWLARLGDALYEEEPTAETEPTP
jgi:CRISPR/Cas system CMR-associated protein Cmr5 small subunit